MLALILLVALFLRVYQLDRFPRGPFSDEAAALILAGEVANAHSWPIFITSYTGHEVLFYYLAAPVIRLLAPDLSPRRRGNSAGHLPAGTRAFRR
jgi:hypothetical protein